VLWSSIGVTACVQVFISTGTLWPAMLAHCVGNSTSAAVWLDANSESKGADRAA